MVSCEFNVCTVRVQYVHVYCKLLVSTFVRCVLAERVARAMSGELSLVESTGTYFCQIFWLRVGYI